MDTTSIALARTFHVLAIHQDSQARLRNELVEAKEACGGSLDFDSLMGLPYLDAVCKEILRL